VCHQKSVRCTTRQCPVHQGLQLRTAHLGNSGGRSAIIHRTIRWRTGLSGVPPKKCPVHHQTVSSAPGTPTPNCSPWEFWRSLRYNSPDYPVAHRTVRCASGATATSAPTVACNRIECATVRARVRAEADGAPDTEQCLSGATPDCPGAPEDRSSNGQNPTAR
jgi:hypothetical protein